MNCLKDLLKVNVLDRSSWNVPAENGLLLNQSKEFDLDRSKVDRLGRESTPCPKALILCELSYRFSTSWCLLIPATVI